MAGYVSCLRVLFALFRPPTLNLALQASGCDQVHVVHKPPLLSDNGSSYVSGNLAEWLKEKGMKHSHGAPFHPHTQGKIAPSRPIALQSPAVQWMAANLEEPHLVRKLLPARELEGQIESFVNHYNHQCYHESINNVTPADVTSGVTKPIYSKGK